MKKYFISLFIILIGVNIFAENAEENKIYKNNLYVAVSPFISPRICSGFFTTQNFNSEKLLETVYYIHGNYQQYDKLIGIAIGINQFFKNNSKSGFYINGNFGVDYIQNNTIAYEGVFMPTITFGLGYSFKIKKTSSIRISTDVGAKWFLANIYLVYVW
jgi:hypothetical protein